MQFLHHRAATPSRVRSQPRLRPTGYGNAENVVTGRLGGLAKNRPGPGRGRKNAVPKENRVLPPTLAEAGIDKKLSCTAQKLAAAPDGRRRLYPTYMELVLSNAQGELSPLEIGMHALHWVAKGNGGRGQKGGLREYASRIGRDESFIRQIRKAAEVAEKCGANSALLTKTQHLSTIHALPESCWPVAVEAMLAKGWAQLSAKAQDQPPGGSWCGKQAGGVSGYGYGRKDAAARILTGLRLCKHCPKWVSSR